MPDDPTKRFSDTVDNYRRYRPGYPQELMEFMKTELHLQPSHAVADIGSGTGKLTELFLHNGNRVYAVEPNGPMREAAERQFGKDKNFISCRGRAERCGLSNNSVDFVTAAQAFHWFEQVAFKRECQSILRQGGWTLLIWNDRLDDRSPFMQGYESFLREFSTDYGRVDLRRVGKPEFDDFFGAGNYRKEVFEHYQVFDFVGLRGRYLSSSYALPTDHLRYDEAIAALRELFAAHQSAGEVRMWYAAEVYYGKW